MVAVLLMVPSFVAQLKLGKLESKTIVPVVSFPLLILIPVVTVTTPAGGGLLDGFIVVVL